MTCWRNGNPCSLRIRAETGSESLVPRSYVEVERLPGGDELHEHQTFEAKINGLKCEVVYEGKENRFWLVRRRPVSKEEEAAWVGKHL